MDATENPQRTLVLVKPGGVQRATIGEVIQRLEHRGFQLVGAKMCWPTKEQAENHYSDLIEKFYYSKLINYVITGPIMCMVWQGNKVIPLIRSLQGSTYPLEAQVASVRGSLCQVAGRNILHASDSLLSARREISVWFQDEELCPWVKADKSWLTEPSSS